MTFKNSIVLVLPGCHKVHMLYACLQAMKQPYRSAPTDQTAKDPWCKLVEQENECTQRHQTNRHQLLPDWYWLAPYGPLDTKADCHINPQTIECLNHLRKQRLYYHQ